MEGALAVPELTAGAARADITPPEGLAMAGSLRARKNVGTDDPLEATAVVFEAGGVRAALVGVDLIALSRATVDEAARLAEDACGIPRDSVLVSASHTHSGPYPTPCFGAEEDLAVEYVKGLPEKLARVIVEADRSRVPCRAWRGRSLVRGVASNRRLVLKSGGSINNWMRPPPNDQVVGCEGPVDPEVGLLRLDDEGGRTFACVVDYTCHVNAHFGTKYSADYAGVARRALAEKLGGAVTVFFPGACGNINPATDYRTLGERVAEGALRASDSAEEMGEPTVAAGQREVELPLRDFSEFQEDEVARLARLWGPHVKGVFREEWERLRAQGHTSARTVAVAVRVGDFAVAGVPGELFVEWGLDIKRKSPVRWTYVAELSNDYVGYLPTRETFQRGGYESLNARSSKVSIEGCELLAETVVGLLGEVS